jgi:hypothetical protein
MCVLCEHKMYRIRPVVMGGFRPARELKSVLLDSDNGRRSRESRAL